MSDLFELLNFPRLPWLDPAEVKQRFAELSGPVHPDRVHQADETTKREANSRYADLNFAAQTLADPKRRLAHLIELQTAEPPSDVGNVPPQISDLFFEVGNVFRIADAVIQERERATSPMVRVQVMRKAFDEAAKLKSLITKLDAAIDRLNQQCRACGEAWSTPDSDRPVEALKQLYRDYSYLTRWQKQATEKQFQLTL